MGKSWCAKFQTKDTRSHIYANTNSEGLTVCTTVLQTKEDSRIVEIKVLVKQRQPVLIHVLLFRDSVRELEDSLI